MLYFCRLCILLSYFPFLLLSGDGTMIFRLMFPPSPPPSLCDLPNLSSRPAATCKYFYVVDLFVTFACCFPVTSMLLTNCLSLPAACFVFCLLFFFFLQHICNSNASITLNQSLPSNPKENSLHRDRQIATKQNTPVARDQSTQATEA